MIHASKMLSVRRCASFIEKCRLLPMYAIVHRCKSRNAGNVDFSIP